MMVAMKLISSLNIVLAISFCFALKHTDRKIHKVSTHIKCGNKSMPLIHVTATKVGNKDDVIHYILSAINRPTIIIKHEMKPTNLTLNASNICNRGGETFRFTEGTSDVSGLIISKVFPYDDEKDEVTLMGTKTGSDIAGNFTWEYHGSNGQTHTFKGIDGDNAKMDFTLQMHDESGHGTEQPKNPINANLTEFRLEMSNLSLTYKKTRYAVEVIFFSADAKNAADARHKTMKYFDDEYTPGIFEMWNIKFLPQLPIYQRTYVTWKPVSYNTRKRNRSSQGLVHIFSRENGITAKDIKHISNPLLEYPGGVPWTLLHSIKPKYYGINVTFGIAKDGFLNAHNYISWSAMVGSGTPPSDIMSRKMILVIAFGLGAPAVVMLIGLLFVVIRRMRVRPRNEITYDEIQ